MGDKYGHEVFLDLLEAAYHSSVDLHRDHSLKGQLLSTMLFMYTIAILGIET
jgi:hypothetical protein